MINKSFLFFWLIALVACQNPGKVNQQPAGEVQEPGKNYYGKTISGDNAVSGAELIAMMENRDSVWVTLTAGIAANCMRSGCWMDLDLGSGNILKVTFKDYEFVIPMDSKGKTATVEGFARRQIIPVDLLKHYAEDEGKSQEEIDAITEEEIAYTFEAIGVIIED